MSKIYCSFFLVLFSHSALFSNHAAGLDVKPIPIESKGQSVEALEEVIKKLQPLVRQIEKMRFHFESKMRKGLVDPDLMSQYRVLLKRQKFLGEKISQAERKLSTLPLAGSANAANGEKK